MLLTFLICKIFAIIIVSVSALKQSDQQRCELKRKIGSNLFPEYFKFGVATAAYQIEGGWNADGKGPSIWDTFVHNNPDKIADLTTPDVGADSYHLFDKDLEALKELKVNFYRFSISWPRVLPNGEESSKNQKGIDYYNNVINKLISNGIEPMVTMNHYDIPEELNKFGGFTNDVIVTYFEHYADFLFKTFGDRVKIWITFNEPFEYCILGYGSALYPPLVSSPGFGDYMCMENTLKAHATAYRLYKSKYFNKQRGKVGITHSSYYYLSKYSADTNRALEYALGWCAHPIFSKSGDYPQVMLDDIARNSAKENRTWSRLSPLSKNWLEVIRGSGDFLGLNYYTSRNIKVANPPLGDDPSWRYDCHMQGSTDPSWIRGKSSWLYCVPEGLEGLLKWIRDNYNNVEVFVTENGWSDEGNLDDDGRIDYIKTHLQSLLNAVNSGCNVTRYTHWSLIDNFEWESGYTEKFGLYYVNYTSDNKERIAKKSASYYRNVIQTRTLSDN